MDSIYGVITALIGAIHFVYNVLWLRTVEGPFVPPEPIVIFELAWSLISFHQFIRTVRTRDRVQIVPLTYVLYTASAVLYTVYLGHIHGLVTDAMTPLWWKVYSAAAGAWFVAGGLTMARRPS